MAESQKHSLDDGTDVMLVAFGKTLACLQHVSIEKLIESSKELAKFNLEITLQLEQHLSRLPPDKTVLCGPHSS